MRENELRQLLGSLSLEEKIGQMNLVLGSFYFEQREDEQIITGPAKELGLTKEDLQLCGSAIGIYGAEELTALQDRYMAVHPHHIPMLFMQDVIHGLKTIFPAPLGSACAFDPGMEEKCAGIAAKESAAAGLHVTYSPMCDLVRDARWGRVMESPGEDPYLGEQLTFSKIRGFQGETDERRRDRKHVSACLKHFVGYGAAQAGREYHAAEISDYTLKAFYLRAFKAGIEAGADMVMCSFNTINGIPVTASIPLLRKVLREELKFDGVLISDYAALFELVAHGYAENPRQAAELALRAGVDIDLMGGVYARELKTLAEEKRELIPLIDQAVFRILKLKNKLGLFENPYGGADPGREKELLLCADHRAASREAAVKSFVLLKNNGILPLEGRKSIAFIGPYIRSREVMSSWAIAGNPADCVTIEEAARDVYQNSETRCFFADGSPMLVDEADGSGDGRNLHPADEELIRNMFTEAVEAAKASEAVVLAIGETFRQSGEACSRTGIGIPKIQLRLYREILKVNRNIAVVLFNGRPLDLSEISASAAAILEVWLPGTESGHAICDVLSGRCAPSGKLAMSFPRNVGQVPIFYNTYSTGRPDSEDRTDRYRSRYLDVPNAPLYHFGYGLSYTHFEISQIHLSEDTLLPGGRIIAAVSVKNTGKTAGEEILQLYLHDIAASVVRPIKELIGFKKICLRPGEIREISFEIGEEQLKFVRADGTCGSEPGKFELWIGDSSDTANKAVFELKYQKSIYSERRKG